MSLDQLTDVPDERIVVNLPSPKAEREYGSTPENWRRSIDLTAITSEPPPRAWILPGWLAPGMVTSLYGAPGVGKTMLGLHLGLCIALGEPFLGMKVRAGCVLILACEDDEAELSRRLFRIARGLGRPLSDAQGRLFVHSRVGLENALVHESRGKVVETELLAILDERLTAARTTDKGIDVLILDNIAQMVPVRESDRPSVTAAVNLLAGVAVRHNVAPLLLGHPAKSPESEYSGSTAWDASVRARGLLKREGKGKLLLRMAKTNNVPPETVTLLYDGDLFRRVSDQKSPSGRTKAQEDDAAGREEIRALIVRAMHYCAETLNVEPTDGHTSPRCLWALMEKHGLNGDHSTADVKVEVAAMLKAGTLTVEIVKHGRGRAERRLRLPKPRSVAA